MDKRPHFAVKVAALVSVAAGCAAPGAGAPQDGVATSAASPSGSASASNGASPSSEATYTNDSGPTESSDTAPVASSGPWPPKLILSDLLEAGTVAIDLGKVHFTAPNGFTKTGDGIYTGNWSDTTASATITISSATTTGDVIADLDAARVWARTALVEIPNAASAAMGDAVVGDTQTWGLTIVDSSGTATTMTFTAKQVDFTSYLMFQSLCSVKVAV